MRSRVDRTSLLQQTTGDEGQRPTGRETAGVCMETYLYRCGSFWFTRVAFDFWAMIRLMFRKIMKFICGSHHTPNCFLFGWCSDLQAALRRRLKSKSPVTSWVLLRWRSGVLTKMESRMGVLMIHHKRLSRLSQHLHIQNINIVNMEIWKTHKTFHSPFIVELFLHQGPDHNAHWRSSYKIRQIQSRPTRERTQTHVNTRRTPADSGVDPEERPGLSDGEEQQSLQVQTLHEQPREVRQDAEVEEGHSCFALRLRRHRGHDFTSETSRDIWVQRQDEGWRRPRTNQHIFKESASDSFCIKVWFLFWLSVSQSTKHNG